jgi:hypothetical protein
MAQVQPYIANFPSSVVELLSSLPAGSEFQEADLTLLVAIAAHGIGVPWERLVRNRPGVEPSPEVRAAISKMTALKRQPFITCDLWASTPKSWRIRSHLGRGLQTYTDRPMFGLQCRQVVYHLYNALVRGTIGIAKVGDEVDLIFYNRAYTSALVVSQEDFCRFLRRWFKFVATLSLE